MDKRESHLRAQTRKHGGIPDFAIRFLDFWEFLVEKPHSRLFWADEPIPGPGPSRRRPEAVLGKLDPAGDIRIFGISEAGGAPVPHQCQLGLVLILEEPKKRWIWGRNNRIP